MQKFSFPTENRQLRFALKAPYDLAAERSEATTDLLTFHAWCIYTTMLELYAEFKTA